jgi:hypothetical protein
MILNLNWVMRSVTRFEAMKPWTRGAASAAPALWGKKAADVKSVVEKSNEAAFSS